MSIVVRVLNDVKGWFCHIGSVVWGPVHALQVEHQLNVEHQIVLVLAGTLEEGPLLSTVQQALLKQVVHEKATAAGLEKALNRIVKGEVEPAHERAALIEGTARRWTPKAGKTRSTSR